MDGSADFPATIVDNRVVSLWCNLSADVRADYRERCKQQTAWDEAHPEEAAERDAKFEAERQARRETAIRVRRVVALLVFGGVVIGVVIYFEWLEQHAKLVEDCQSALAQNPFNAFTKNQECLSLCTDSKQGWVCT